MELFRLFWNESRRGTVQLASVTVFAGLVNALLAAVIIFAAGAAAAVGPSSSSNDRAAYTYQPDLRFSSMLLFALCLTAFVISRHFVTRRSASVAEDIATKIRLRIVDEIRNANLLKFERVESYDIDDTLIRSTAFISGAAPSIASALSSVLMLLCSTAYLAFISRPAFVLILGGIAAGISVFFINYKSFWREMLCSAQLEKVLFGFISHLRRGFKQVKLHVPRHRDLYERHIIPSARKVKEAKRRFAYHFAGLGVLSQTLLYCLLGVVVFIVPTYSPLEAGKVIQIAAVILFIIGPLSEVVGTAPQLLEANAAIHRIAALEERLSSAAGRTAHMLESSATAAASFEKIEMQNISFAYDEKSKVEFELNIPVFRLNTGTLIFLIGGNGSGKSTFLKILTGLYEPEVGNTFITWPLAPDGALRREPVTPANLQEFRSLFSTVFADFHLFDRLYGLAPSAYPLVTALLRQMELDNLIAIDAAGRFISPRNGESGDVIVEALSTGQRKRLALVVALAEERPILVLDEFAADQDPRFREKFYLEHLSSLRATRAVLAVTHDEHYFDRVNPDEIWEMGLDRKLRLRSPLSRYPTTKSSGL